MADSEERAGLSGTGRWAVAIAAVVVLVVAFVVLRGGSDNEPAGQPAAPASSTPSSGQTPTQTQEQQTEQAQKPPAAAVPTIRVRGGRPVGGTKTLEFRKGERIRFRVVADQADEVHFHGYDIEKSVAPGAPARFDAKATIEGRFEVELHHAGAQVARVQVVP